MITEKQLHKLIPEEDLHRSICEYIKRQYPSVIFNSDLSGLYMTNKYRAASVKKLRSGNGFPDIMILEPKHFINSTVESYFALFLEVKKETPYKKNGELKKSDHLYEQKVMHAKLEKLGYKAEFVWTFGMAIDIINEYLN